MIEISIRNVTRENNQSALSFHNVSVDILDSHLFGITIINNKDLHLISKVTNSEITILLARGKQTLQIVGSLIDELQIFDIQIMAEDSLIHIPWCEFSGNRFLHEENDMETFILASRSNITISHCHLSGKVVGYLHASESDVSIENTTFYRNTPPVGLIQVHDDSKLLLKNTWFRENGFLLSESAITVSNNSSANISLSTFLYNMASNGSCVYLGGNCSVSVHRSEFGGNAASDSGGVFFAEAHASVNLQSSRFLRNRAEFNPEQFTTEYYIPGTKIYKRTNRGGGVIYASTESKISIENSTFEQNTCALCCGSVVLFGRGGRVIVKDSQFIRQMSQVSSICWLDPEELLYLHVKSNEKLAFYNVGTSIYGEGHSEIRMTSSIWNSANEVEFSFGTIIFCSHNCSVGIGLQSKFINIIQERHSKRLNLLFLSHGTIEIMETVFENVTVKTILAARLHSTVFLRNSLFLLNEEVCLELKDNSSATVTNTTFRDNRGGPLIILYDSHLRLRNSSFEENSMANMILAANSSLLVEQSHFPRNSVSNSMLKLLTSYIELKHVTFAQNTEGLLHLQSCNVMMQNTTIFGQQSLQMLSLFVGHSRIRMQYVICSNYVKPNNGSVVISPDSSQFKFSHSHVNISNSIFHLVSILVMKNSQVHFYNSSISGAVLVRTALNNILDVTNCDIHVTHQDFVSLDPYSCVISVDQNSSLNLARTNLLCHLCADYLFTNLVCVTSNSKMNILGMEMSLKNYRHAKGTRTAISATDSEISIVQTRINRNYSVHAADQQFLKFLFSNVSINKCTFVTWQSADIAHLFFSGTDRNFLAVRNSIFQTPLSLRKSRNWLNIHCWKCPQDQVGWKH